MYLIGRLFTMVLIFTFGYHAVKAMDTQEPSPSQLTYAIAYRQGDEDAYEDSFFARRSVLVKPENIQPAEAKASGDHGAILSLFDGCGGHKVAAYAKKKLANTIWQQIAQMHDQSQQPDIKQLLIENFKKTDDEIVSDKELRYLGSTALVMYMYNNQAHIAWVGDTRAVIMRDGVIIFSTKDHVLSQEAETGLAYLQEGSDHDSDCEYDETDIHALKLSRALGVLQARPWVTADPEIAVVNVQEKDLLLLATKGLWGALSDDEIVASVHQHMLTQIDSNKMSEVKPVVNRHGSPKIYGEHGAHRNARLLHVARELRDEAYKKKEKQHNITILLAKIGKDGQTV